MTECPLHDGMVEFIKDERAARKEEQDKILRKLDQLIERQAFHHEEVVTVKNMVSNGLRSTTEQTASDVRDLCAEVKAVCKKYDGQFDELKPAKKLADRVAVLQANITEKVVIGIFIIIGALAIAHFGNQFVTNIIKLLT